MGSSTPGRALWLLIKWTFLLTGPLFLCGALIFAHHTQKFLRESVTVQGRVVGLKPVRSSRDNSLTFAPVFRFNVPGSHFVTVVSNFSSNPAGFKPGQMVTVHYEKDHPENAKIDSFMQLWFGASVFAVLGAFFTAVSLIILLFARKVNRRDPALSNDGSGITRL